MVCKIWYLGDGSLISDKNSNSQRIVLYTNCFEKSDLEKNILPQLQDFEPRLINMNKKLETTGFAICIGKKENIKRFLRYIGDCPFDDYAYKWAVKQ